jgi:hypothetical protein
MPGCDTGRNVQKYRGGGGGASTLQEALENGNISTLAIELQSGGVFIGDGGGLSNIAGVGGSVGNMQQVTTSGATTSNKIILTNTNESLQASGNVTVNSGKFFLGDGGLLSNTAGTVTLQQASNQGNVINNIVSFTNAAESIVTTGKIVVGTSLEATSVTGNGSGLSSINASNVSSGTINNDRLSTKTGTGNIVMSANPTLSGTITGGTFSGTHTGNGSGLSSLNASNISSGTLHSDRLPSKTGTGNVVMSANPTLSGTITGGTFSGTHTGNGSGLTTLNASNISSGTLASDRLPSKTGTGNVVMSANPTLSGTITGGTFAGTHTGNGSGLTTLNATNISSGTLHSDRLPSKTGAGNVVMSANPTLSGTITGGTFAGTHTGNGSGLSSLNASNVSTGTLHNDRLSTKTGTGNIVMSTNPTLSGTITGGTFAGTHTGNGSGLSSLNATNISSGTLSNDRLGTVPYNKGGTGQTSYTRGDIIYSNANNSLAKLSIGTESGMFLRSDGTDVSWGTDGSRLTSINASNVSSGILTTSRGGTGNTFSSASKSDLLVGTSGGTFAKLSIPASSATDKILKIDGSNNLYWGPDSTSSGSGGGGSGVLSLGSTFMKYASGVDYNTSTGRTITLEASTNDLASNIVVRDANKNINVTKVTLGTGTLTQDEYSGKSATVTVSTDNGGTERDLAFVNGNSILEDDGGKLKWKPNPGELYIGPSNGTRTKLTNTKWFGESATVTINNTTASSIAAPVLMHEAGGIVRKDTSNRLTWTATGTHAGTLTIGTIDGTHSNITSSTFTGESANVKITSNTHSTPLNIALTNTTESNTHIVKDTDGDFTYKPDDGTLKIRSGTLESIITPSTFSGESANVKITSNTHSTPLNIALTNTTESNTHIVKDTDGDFTYKPDDGTLKIRSGTLESIITPSTFSGESANVKVTEHTSNTDLNIALIKETVSNTHIVRDTNGEFKYNPYTGTVSATKFSGNGSGLTHLNFEESNNSGEVPVDHGGTGFGSYNIGNMLYAGTTTSFTKIGPPGGNNETKFLKYVTDGSGGLSSIGWGDPSVSQISITDDTSSATGQGITFAADVNSQTIKSDQSTLHYKPSTGTLTTSNLITSDTSTNARNGISNGNPTHTLSVGTVVSIQETSTGDVLIVRGNGYFNDDVYIAKKLTLPSGSVLVADTIRVRSHNVKETLVVAERPASQLSV